MNLCIRCSRSFGLLPGRQTQPAALSQLSRRLDQIQPPQQAIPLLHLRTYAKSRPPSKSGRTTTVAIPSTPPAPSSRSRKTLPQTSQSKSRQSTVALPDIPPPKPLPHHMASDHGASYRTQILQSHTEEPLVLYTAPATNTFFMTAGGLSTFSTFLGLKQIYFAYFVPHPGLYWIVPHMYGIQGIFFLAMGWMLGTGAFRLASRLEATARSEVVNFRLTTRFGRVHEVPLEDVRITIPLAQRAARHLDTELMKPRVGIVQTVVQKLDEERGKGSPSAVARLFREARDMVGRLVNREGFVEVWVRGTKWKIDVRDGWVRGGGVPLDRLLKEK